MPKRYFSDWLAAYMEYTEYSESPLVFHYWTGVHTIAAALRRKVWLDMGYFQWYPNFYIVFVSPPGIVSKSTTLRIGHQLLRQVEGIQFGPEAITWQALVTTLAESTEAFPLEDGTFMPMSAVTIGSGEFGTLLNPNDREMVDILVALWDGQTGVFEKKTKTSGHDRIENPWINIAACTTPAWIQGNFPEYLIGGGFTSRCIFVYAAKKKRYIAYPGLELPPGFKKIEEKLVEDLRQIAGLIGAYRLSPDAVAWGTAWYEKHYANKDSTLTTERFAGYWARKQTHIHKLAMVIAASQGTDLVIETGHLQLAEKILTALEGDMPRVFETIGAAPDAKYLREVLTLLIQRKKVKRDDLFRLVMAHMSYTDFENAMKALVANGIANLTQEGMEIFVTINKEKLSGAFAD